MLHFLSCLGTLPATQLTIANQLVDDTVLWISSWSVTPPALTLGGAVSVSYTASDLGGAPSSGSGIIEGAGQQRTAGFMGRRSGALETIRQWAHSCAIHGHAVRSGEVLVRNPAGRQRGKPGLPTIGNSGDGQPGFRQHISLTVVSRSIHGSRKYGQSGGQQCVKCRHNQFCAHLQSVHGGHPDRAACCTGEDFSSWSGCDLVFNTLCAVTMTANRTVTANYASTGSVDLGTVSIGQTSAVISLPITFTGSGTAGSPVGLTMGAAGLDFRGQAWAHAKRECTSRAIPAR